MIVKIVFFRYNIHVQSCIINNEKKNLEREMLIFLFIITLIHLFCLTCTFMMLFIYVYIERIEMNEQIFFSLLSFVYWPMDGAIVSFVLWINTKTFSIRHWRSTRAHADIEETREREKKNVLLVSFDRCPPLLFNMKAIE
jgi:hypothetical protein